MLYSFDSDKYIKTLPHKKQYDMWRKKLSNVDHEIICNEIMQHFNEKEVNTSSFIPGKDWTGTVYDPLYHACGGNVEASGLFFGLIVWKLLMDNPDVVWGFGRYRINDVDIRGMTYFIVSNPPEDR